ncbi:MAG: efflux RND transporter permease subunit [Rhodobacteraceae bacterium]|jgi:multidrug efflux pump|nr:efflux RND transporter permease subunit [Paracoccaceae bacterium]MBT4228785.1 efflux RND transporter permease subunit [Paracoccaceae bacterium]MBT4953005.1 efflux RND transporter permease subunit [Paracoccaceae bacterium]MBT5853329.1 efflux RND transporter permease subunit [Paracoccaceae bacterium]MBT6897703.1 efflux RND transporter permease subunit [Paracoccaceae bacterium]
MTGLVDWAAERARMILAMIALSLTAGIFAYTTLPKEGEPDIEIPVLFVSVVFPGISAADSEALLVRPIETELADLDGLKRMTATAAENYAGVAIEFEFGWDKAKTMADARDAMNAAEALFPEGAEKYSINEINFSEFPIIIVNLTGNVPERTMTRIAEDLQEEIEGMDAVLEAVIAGNRKEMMEVVIDPLRLEAYNVTAGELISVVRNNNQLIAAGEVDTAQGSFSVKIPSSFDEPRDIYNLPVKTNGDRVITLGDLADIRLTFEDRVGTARYNGETTVALQVVKRKGFNLIKTAAAIRALIEEAETTWPPELRAAVDIGSSNDQSRVVASMVSQLEGSVLTAIALVMIVVLASLGTRAALLVGFAIPTSFLLCFVLLAVMGITISNIVMFGLILAVGMLVDGAIVVVEYADKRITEGEGPMRAYVEAAKRMFWPVVSSTATTLCAFLPMLFWPGVPGQFMGMLPVTLIFVLSASLIVALVYLPVVGGVSGRMGRGFDGAAAVLRARLPWILRAALVPVCIYAMFLGAMQTVNPDYLFGLDAASMGAMAALPGALMFLLAAFAASVAMGAAKIHRAAKKVRSGYRRTNFGFLVKLMVANPIMPLVMIFGVFFFAFSVFEYFGENNRGVEFFVESEPEQAIVYVKARGNLSLPEKDRILKEAEAIVLAHPGVESVFAFAGAGGLNQNTSGAEKPKDTIAQIQLETIPWENRRDRPELDGNLIMKELIAALEELPGIQIEVLGIERGPASNKPVHLRLTGDNWPELLRVTQEMRNVFDQTEGLTLVEDTRPLPGIDWQIDVDVEKAGRYGADVATVGAMVQLVTRGILLDTMRVETSDEEIEIRVRLPEKDRVLSTLDGLKLRTREGLVPLSNFITRQPVQKLAEINRIDQKRYFDIKAGVLPGLSRSETDAAGVEKDILINANERIAFLTRYLEANPLPPGVSWEWTGDQEDEAESQAFLSKAFIAALALMFIILLAQFNSFFNSFIVLLAVVLSTVGVLIGMLVMQQAFSIIMTGTGIVALAGIVVNNNIVLIDTYQELSRYMPRIEAIIRTAEQRIRPVLLTTITTMAGLAPMMFGLSLDFINGGYSIDSPTALWWKQLATAVVFGLGIATVLTLLLTPSLLAARYWVVTYIVWIARALAVLGVSRQADIARDWALNRMAKRLKQPEIIWDDLIDTPVAQKLKKTATGKSADGLQAAE